jgi:hypothetical protein
MYLYYIINLINFFNSNSLLKILVYFENLFTIYLLFFHAIMKFFIFMYRSLNFSPLSISQLLLIYYFNLLFITLLILNIIHIILLDKIIF